MTTIEKIIYLMATQVSNCDRHEFQHPMVPGNSAKLFNPKDYGIAIGKKADIVTLNNSDQGHAVVELSQPAMGFKNGRQTFNCLLPEILKPE